ncbi:hypothetical protein PF004_g100 [Phytophthora fragariae]|uniref:Uncharacterized protein n=1 Tax=Phytophthora fragariae TaxID=53985 RepID=A0A6G0RMN9_9STRA|nr:hypothetical protein PF004_g100 [Phytophthora fragariae]KAE9337536.1 hypothetical protein PF008_g12491 [Phytophthora fragariae]
MKMCCLAAERLNGDNGTRVTLVDASYIAQITVWDAKGKKGFASKANLRFRPSGLYEFRQVDGVMFYADIPSGRVQYDRGAPDKIVEVPPPPNKRKSPRESPAKKKGKGKLREANLDIDVDDVGELDGDSGHDLGASADAMDESCGSIRTRSSVAPPA